MFEICRERSQDGDYRVVYFTELDDHNKEAEINRAMAGEHLYDGFIGSGRRGEAKEAIAGILELLNNGQILTPADVQRRLGPYAPQD